MSAFSLVVFLSLSQVRAADVLVVSYQSVGLPVERTRQWEETLIAAVVDRKFSCVPYRAALALERSATMCGEDLACLSTLGLRAEARWVLAFGLAKVGSDQLVSVRLLEVQSARLVNSWSDRQPLLEQKTLAAEAVASVFEGVAVSPLVSLQSPSVRGSEASATAPEASVRLADNVMSRPIRPAVWTLGIVSVVSFAAAIVFGILANSNFASLKNVAAPDRLAADSRQRVLNVGVDLSLAIGLVTGATAAVVWATTPVSSSAAGTP